MRSTFSILQKPKGLVHVFRKKTNKNKRKQTNRIFLVIQPLVLIGGGGEKPKTISNKEINNMPPQPLQIVNQTANPSAVKAA